jgi:hypothetical protein
MIATIMKNDGGIPSGPPVVLCSSYVTEWRTKAVVK